MCLAAKTLPTKFYVVQGAGVAIMICASRLGEVFYTWPWAIVHAVLLYVCCCLNVNSVWVPATIEASIEGFDERIEIREAEEKSQHAAPMWKEENV